MTEPVPIPLDALTTRAGHLTEQVLERLAAERRDGIPDDEPGLRAAADLHLVGCERCRAAIDQLAGDALALPPLPALTSPTSASGSPRPAAPIERVPRHRPRSHWWGALALAAVALILVVRPTAPDGDELRLKGGALDFEVRDARDRALADGAVVHPGDRLYFYLRVARPAYVAVWGRSEGGEVYVIHPSVASAADAVAVALAPSAAPGRLAEAIELDAVGAGESLVAIACDTPRRLADLGFSDAAARDAGCATRLISLRKVSRP